MNTRSAVVLLSMTKYMMAMASQSNQATDKESSTSFIFAAFQVAAFTLAIYFLCSPKPVSASLLEPLGQEEKGAVPPTDLAEHRPTDYSVAERLPTMSRRPSL